MIKRTASFGKAIKRSASFGRRKSEGDRGNADAPRLDRSASLLTDELDDSAEPSFTPLPHSPSVSCTPPVSCGLSALQGLLLKRHQSSRWTKWGRRWFEVDDYKRTLSYYATEVRLRPPLSRLRQRCKSMRLPGHAPRLRVRSSNPTTRRRRARVRSTTSRPCTGCLCPARGTTTRSTSSPL